MMAHLKSLLKMMVTFTVLLMTILIFIQISILAFKHLNLDWLPSFTAHCIEHPSIENSISSPISSNNEVIYVINHEVNIHIYQDTLVESEEIETRRSCTSADVKSYAKWIIPGSVVGGIWSYYWSTWVWEFISHLF